MTCALQSRKKKSKKYKEETSHGWRLFFHISGKLEPALRPGYKKGGTRRPGPTQAADGAHLASRSLTTRALAYRDIMRPDSSRTRAKTPAFALLVCSIALLVRGCNGQTPAPDASGGSYVDVSSNATSEVEGRFGTQPSQRSGQSLVRLQTRYAPQHPRSDRSTSSRNEHATVSFLGTR